MNDPLATTTGLTRVERDALRTLAHALDACGLPLVTVDDRRMSPNQRAFWTSYVLIPATVAAANRQPALTGKVYEPSGYAADLRAAGRGHLLGDR